MSQTYVPYDKIKDHVYYCAKKMFIIFSGWEKNID